MKRILFLAALTAAIGLLGQNAYAQVASAVTDNGATATDNWDSASVQMNSDGTDATTLTLTQGTTLNFGVDIENNANVFALDDNTLTLDTFGNTVNLNGVIDGGVGGNIVVQDTTDAGGTLTLNGDLTGFDGGLTLASGNLVLGGTNTFTGGIAFTAGTLDLLTSAAAGTNDITFGNGTSRTLILHDGQTYTNVIATGGNDGTIQVDSGMATLKGAAVITNAGNLTKTGAGAFQFVGTNPDGNAMDVTEGAFMIGDGTATNATTYTGAVTVRGGAMISGNNYDGTDTNSVLDGALTLESGSLFTARVGDDAGIKNFGLTVADTAGNTITVEQGANIAMDFEGGIGSVADWTGVLDFGAGDNAAWVDLDLANAALIQNPFYRIVALDDTGNGQAQFGLQRLANAQIPELYAMSSQFHHYRTTLDASNNRMTQNFEYECRKPSYAGKCGTGYDNGLGCGTAGKSFGNSLWVNYVGRKNDQMRSSYLGSDLDFTSNGIQLGLDLYSSKCSQFGIMFGYEDQELEGFGNKLTADDFYFGFYGAKRFGSGWDVRGAIGYGHQEFDQTRTNRIFRATTDYDADTFEANIELGRRFSIGRYTSIRPVIGLDFYNFDADSASETGNDPLGNYMVNYAGLSLTQLYGRFGTDLQYNCGRWNLNGGAYYSYQLNSDGDVSRAIVTNGLQNAIIDYDLGKSIVSLNVGGEYYFNHARSFSLFGGYGVDLYTDRDGDPVLHKGQVGVQWRF